ncbi:MAG TPA: YitT family protein [Thermovirgaceae bacterium]|nr:YitT family protein [Thermovirgaceae bacterium]
MRIRKKIVHATVAVRREIPTFALMTFGATIVAFGIMSLTIPYRFPDSGVSGIAVLSSYLFGISPAWIVGIANLVLLAWGLKELSPRFIGWTVYAVMLLTLLLKLFEGIPYPHLDERLLVAILAGVVKGLGGGLVLRSGSSLGGTDIIVVVLRKRYGVEVGKFTFYINLAILGISVFIVGLEGAIYGLVSIFANGLVTDNVLRSFDRRRQVIVISNTPREIAAFITGEMHRGVTILHGEGGYTHEERPALLCVLTPRQTMDLKNYLSVHDPKAFMIVSDASEVMGRGFKNWTEL